MEELVGAVMGLTLGQIQKDADQDYNEKQSEHEKFRQSWWQNQSAAYQQRLAMQTWDQTNYAAQMAQIKKAGLNPGLIYKGAGEGGSIGSHGTNSISQTSPIQHTNGMAMQLGMQAAMNAAQIKNINANTEKTKVETAKTAGVDTQQAQANIAQTTTATEKLKTEIKNAELQNLIMQSQQQLAQVEANIATLTQKEAIEQIQTINDKLYGEAQSALTKANVDKTTRRHAIQLIEQSTIEQQLRIATQKVNIQVSQTTINKIATEINMMQQHNMREWDKMTQTEKEIAVKQLIAKLAQQQTEFNTSAAAHVKQWTSIIGDIMSAETGAQTRTLTNKSDGTWTETFQRTDKH